MMDLIHICLMVDIVKTFYRDAYDFEVKDLLIDLNTIDVFLFSLFYFSVFDRCIHNRHLKQMVAYYSYIMVQLNISETG